VVSGDEVFCGKDIKIYKADLKPAVISAAIPFLLFLFILAGNFFEPQFIPLKKYLDLTYPDFIFSAVGLFFILYFLFSASLRKIILTPEGILNKEWPVFILFHYSRGIAEELKWDEIRSLEIKRDFFFSKLEFFYIRGKNGKFIAFSPKSVKNSGELISEIEKRTGKIFIK